MITFEWEKKYPSVDYFGECSGFNFILKGTDSESGRTETANALVILGDDELKHIDEWTQQEINDLAEEKRALHNLDGVIERRLKSPLEDGCRSFFISYFSSSRSGSLSPEVIILGLMLRIRPET